MRGFTKSILSYTWSTSLFGVQQMVNLFTPQGWRQTDRAAQSFERITKAMAEEMGDLAKSTFKVGNDLQRRGVDMAFGLVTLEVFGGGKGPMDDSGTQPGSSGTGSAPNVGQQASDVFTQSLQAVGQTVGVIGQALSGVFSSQGCGGSQSQPTGWGPVPPPSGGAS